MPEVLWVAVDGTAGTPDRPGPHEQADRATSAGRTSSDSLIDLMALLYLYG
ncbi:MAG: hypothetical protein ACK54T_04990 [bacterium]